jgi:hypothetical protein
VRISLIPALLAAAATAPALAQITLTPLVLDGDPVPGLPGQVFTSTNLQSSVAITSDGTVVFAGVPSGVGSVVCTAGPGGTRLVSRDGPAPGGGTFSFSNGVFNIRDSGDVAFAYAGARLYAEVNHQLILVAGIGTAIPNVPGGTITGRVLAGTTQGSAFWGNGGDVSFTASFNDGATSAVGLFSGPADDFRLIARTVPSNQIGYTQIATPIVNPSGVLAFTGSRSEGGGVTRSVLVRGTPDNLQEVLTSGVQAPGLPDGVVFQSFGFVTGYLGINSAGTLVFGARLVGPGVSFNNDGSAWILDDSGYRLIAREGDPVPGDPTSTFATIFDGDTPAFPVIGDGGHVLLATRVFTSGASQIRGSILLLPPGGTLREVARAGWHIPGRPPQEVLGELPFFRPLQINARGQVAFMDTQNLYAIDEEGRVRLLVDSFNGPAVRLSTGETGAVQSLYLAGSSNFSCGGADGKARILNDDGVVCLHASVLPTAGPVKRGIFTTRIPRPCEAADFDGNGTVDFFDYLDFAAAFDAEDPRADFNGDETIDFFDYLDFVQSFGAGCD